MQSYYKVLVICCALQNYCAGDSVIDHTDIKDPFDFLQDDVDCILPEYPKNGFYQVKNVTNTRPGQSLSSATLVYSCHLGYQLVGHYTVYCNKNHWFVTDLFSKSTKVFPECVPATHCVLENHKSVNYICYNNLTSSNNRYLCGDAVEDGTVVTPSCRKPGYYLSGVLKNMHCQNGIWDHIVICSPKNMCSVPNYPKNGYYTFLNEFENSERYENLNLKYSCRFGYKLVGSQFVSCEKGLWLEIAPICISQCLLNKHPSIQYLCLPRNYTSQSDTKECGDLVDEGTIVKSVCRENYYSSGILSNMYCMNGEWNNVNYCSAECGLVTPEGNQMVLGGRNAKHGDLPWHAGIYDKGFIPYKLICGGTLISRTVVISAAHCFWSNQGKQLPALDFAIAVGKIYRPWNNPRDENVQKSDVRSVKIPSRFLGAAANFQEDIAVVTVQSAFEFNIYVRPICTDFDYIFNQRQLHVGALGKVAGWGITSEDGVESRVLQVAELPYVDIETCISASPLTFYQFITSDKICAGAINGTTRTVCKGDSGGGLAFMARERGADRYFLRGIVSTAPTSDHNCNAHAFTTFTQVTKHEEFIKHNVQMND